MQKYMINCFVNKLPRLLINFHNIDFADKYKEAQQTIKVNYADFEVPYNGIDNDDYVNGQGFCCDDATGLRAGNDNPELFQYYYHSDHLGSTSLITDLDGNVVQHVEYVPFGEVFIEERNNKWNTPYLFNAKELDEETGLYYYGTRYYDARLSLLLGADPMQEKYPDVSTYAYCVQNPVKFIDPDGREAWEVNNQWDDDYINKFSRFVYNQTNQYVNDGSQFTCEDFALSLLIDFASTNGLPVTINNGSGTYDARSDNYTDVATFKNDVLTTTGARDLQNNNNTVSSDISGARGGDIIVNRNSNNVGTHIQVVTAGFYIDNTDFVNGVSVAQGNSGLLNGVPGSSTIFDAGNPNSFFYTGKPIERGWIDVNANVYFNNTKGTTISNYSNAKNIDVRRWNFSVF
jgi:RHS repeat-associated protein